MSDNKLVKSIIDAATITGLVAGIGFLGRKIIKEDLGECWEGTMADGRVLRAL